jgi:hypothetical protein
MQLLEAPSNEPRMLQPTWLATSFLTALLACSASQDERPDAKASDHPLARSGRLIGGEWRQTALSGKTMYTTSHWGPGKHSLRSMTHGFGAGGEPWRDLGVAYWHPGRKQLLQLGLTPFRHGVSEGVIQVEGDTSEAFVDLYQTGDHRKLVARTVFEGPDKYRSALLEVIGSADPAPLGEWEFFRSWTLTPVIPLTASEAGSPSVHLKALEPFLDQAWKSTGEPRGDWTSGAGFTIQAIVEWITLADGIYARVLGPLEDGEPVHLLDAYVFHHTGTGAVRCLALSHLGGVYEGDLTVLENGALELALQGYEGDRLAPIVARFDFEEDGAVRSRFWSRAGSERELKLDLRLAKLAPAKD